MGSAVGAGHHVAEGGKSVRNIVEEAYEVLGC